MLKTGHSLFQLDQPIQQLVCNLTHRLVVYASQVWPARNLNLVAFVGDHLLPPSSCVILSAMTINKSSLLDVGEVAAICKVTRGRVRQWASTVRGAQRLKPARRIGNALAFRRADVYRLRKKLAEHPCSAVALSEVPTLD